MATQVASLFGVLRMDDSQFKESVRDAKDDSQSLGERLQKLGGSVTSLGVGMTAIGAPVAAFFGLSVKGAAEMQSAMAQTDTVIKSTGGAAGQTTDQIVKMASSMQALTGIQDDQIVSGENLLLTFTGISGKTFPRATKAMLDMSVAMKQDLRSSAMQLGKALNDPAQGLGALTKNGVTFTDQQQEMIKAMAAAGDTAGAQAVILQELEREFGGSAEAAGQTFAGQLAIAQRQVEDIQDEIGAALIPTLSDLLTQVKPILGSIMDWVKANPDLIKGIALIAGGLTILGPILIGAGAAISAIGGIIGVVLSPIGLLVAAVAGLYIAFQTNFLGIRDFLQPVVDKFNEMGGVPGILDKASTSAQQLLTLAIAPLKDPVQKVVDKFNEMGGIPGILDKASTSGQQLLTLAIAPLQDPIQKVVDKFNEMGGVPGILDSASTSAQQLGAIGLFMLTDNLNKAAISAGQLVDIFKDWTAKNQPLLINVRDLAIAFLGAQGLIAGFTAVQTAMKAGETARAAFLLWVNGTLLPVTALTAAILALIKAFEAVQKFQGEVQTAVQGADQALGAKIRSGEIAPQQYQQASFNAQVAAFGGGFGGDLMTRLLQQFPGWNMIMNTPLAQNAPKGDYQGVHPAGAYVVGTGAQPQLFMPQQDMYGIPNIDKALGGGSVTINGLTINANSAAEGREAARGFKQELEDLMRAQG